MYQKVLISKSNEATFVCPKCEKTKTVDVSKYKYVQNRIKVKAKCICGYSWTSILERRRFYRVDTDIPCVCSKSWVGGFDQNISMKISELSPGGLKLEPDERGWDSAHAIFFRSPFIVNFSLGDNNKIHIKKTAHPVHISKTHVSAKFDESERGDLALFPIMLRQG